MHWPFAVRLLVRGILLAVVPVGLLVWQRLTPEPRQRLLGEFEKQQALVLCWENEQSPVRSAEAHQQIHSAQLEIISQVWENIGVVIVVNDAASRQQASAALTAAGVPLQAVRFVTAPFDRLWVRDFGPQTVVDQRGRVSWIDGLFFPPGHIRPLDEQIPTTLARHFGRPVKAAPLVWHGGYVISNGDGLLVTTKTLLYWNGFLGFTGDQVTQHLRDHYGAEQVVYLEPLQGEPTGHVDMFATFTDRRTIVVGRYPAEQNPTNAAILDSNAETLSRIRTRDGPLRVERVPMPPRTKQELWGGTYTNVVFANGVLVVPTYGADPQGEAEAMALFQRLLPGWKVVGVESNALLRFEGGPRCATLQLGGPPP